MKDWLSWQFWVDTTPGAIHFLLAVICLVLGAFVLFSRKGNTRHRVLGSLWLVLMITVNTSALSMYEVSGRVNLFHFFAVLSLATIIPGYVNVRRYALTGKRDYLIAHRVWMTWGYFGLANAGAWQIINRLIHTFVGPGHFDTVIIVLVGATILASVAMNGVIKRRLVEMA